jgi:hypothetical protein
MQDFLGNSLSINDKVVAVMGRHLRKSVIEEIIPRQYYGTTKDGYTVADLKINGLKTIIPSNAVIKVEWQETVK